MKLETGADLLALEELDQKLWVALACPTTGIHFDLKTAALIDSDKDGRIRAPELMAAVKWAGRLLKNPDDLVKGLNPLPLEAIQDGTPEGAQLKSSARQILANLGKQDAAAISVEDTVDTGKIFAQTAFNGDGIIVESSAQDDQTKGVIRDMIACLGGEEDRGGQPGVSQGRVEAFFAEAQAYSDWWKKAEEDSKILPLNGGTAAAAATVQEVKAKVNDYFARCRLAAFDARALAALNREEKEYLALAAKDLTISSAEIATFPLAQVGAAKPLPLREALNPAWAGAMARFETQVVRPILNGKGVITETDWQAITDKFSAYESWMTVKAGAAVEKLGLPRVREILAGDSKRVITELIAKDKAEEGNANSIAAVERLVRYARDLYLLCANFVNFEDFYDRGEPAIFQAGTLYLDQRSCELTLVVDDAAKHATMAALAGAYIAYCDCSRKATGEKLTIAAIFSQGDDENLMVGRNGVFYDRKGRDWDATITKIIANPISLRQAFWLPYKKFVRMIEEQIAKRAAAADAASTEKLSKAATAATEIDKQAPAAPAAAGPKKIDIGVVAALGVAVGAIGGALGAITTGLAKLAIWQIPLVIIGVVLAISLPSVVIAYLKLRKRNLGPILDANGWAVNARARINVPFGASLTGIAKLPPGAQRDLADPFADKKRPWTLYIILFLLCLFGWLWYAGKLDGSLPGSVKSTTVLGTNAPAYKRVTPPPAPSAGEAPVPATGG